MKRTTVLTILFLFFAFTAIENPAQGNEQDKPDKIRIVSVTTAKPIQNGVLNEFTAEIEYTVESAAAAAVSIGFNTEKPSAYRMTTRKKVNRRTNFIILKADVIPKDWKERGDFVVYVNISPHPPTQSRYVPSATTLKAIDFEF